MIKYSITFTLLVILASSLKSQTQKDTLYNYITNTPVTIDGQATEECWTNAEWHNMHQVLIPYGASMKAGDFTGKFKVTWDEQYLYVLVEVVDDSLSDDHVNPTQNWWDDDCVEAFIDENRSGGGHETNNNAFAYHVSLFNDAIDLNSSGGGVNYKNNLEVDMDTLEPKTYLWEMAFKNYDATFNINNPEASRVLLSPNKLMGFALAYCDNDETQARENFISSMTLSSATANDLYKNASLFGLMKLVDPDFVEPIQLNLNTPINICTGETAIIDAGSGFATYTWSNNVTDTSQIEVSDAGNYSVTVTDATGATAYGNVEVIIRELPVVNLGSDITQNGSIELDAGSGFASYLWSTNSENQTITVNETGAYWVMVSNNYNCYNTDTITITITNASDVYSLYYYIYPNPVYSQLNVTNISNETGFTSFAITSINGQFIKSGSFQGNSHTISVNELKTGMYLLELKSNDNSYTRLFTKE